MDDLARDRMERDRERFDPDLAHRPVPRHQTFEDHVWRFGTVIMHPVHNVISGQSLARPSVLMVCYCGAQNHEYVIDPS